MIKKVFSHVKNRKWLRIVLLCGFIFLSINAVLAYLANRYDVYSEFKLRNNVCIKVKKGVDAKISSTKNISDFPIDYILDTLLVSRDYTELMFILNSMDSSGLLDVDGQFVSILTESLYNKRKDKYLTFNPDNLSEDIIWAEKLNSYAEVDANNERIFSAISGYWFDVVCRNLSQLSKTNSSLKFQHSFKYLVTRCSQNNYKTDVGTTKSEKIVNNIIAQKWYYLWNRLIGGTSILFKTVVGLVIMLILFSFYTSFLFVRKKL